MEDKDILSDEDLKKTLEFIMTSSTRVGDLQTSRQKIIFQIDLLREHEAAAMKEIDDLVKMQQETILKFTRHEFASRMKELGRDLSLDDVVITDFPFFKSLDPSDQDLVLRCITWKITGSSKYRHVWRSGEEIRKELVLSPEEYRETTFDVYSRRVCTYCKSIYHLKIEGESHSPRRCPQLDKKFCVVCKRYGHDKFHCNVKVKDLVRRQPKTPIT